MIKKVVLYASILFVLVPSQLAHAFISFYGFYGKSWYESDFAGSSKVSAEDTSWALHFDPIPLVPVSFGLSYTLSNLNKKEFGQSLNSVSAVSIKSTQVEVMAWLPMVPMITPYGKVGYMIGGDFAVKDSVTGLTAKSDVVGLEYALGIKRSLFPMAKFLIEAGQAKYSLEKNAYDGKDFDKPYVRFGLEIGI